ncbi:hypothetical protein Pan216_47100 [Planctomycetes bacterium Pan216]|uniref:Uncharacterized protein n=1 Tax=Kolteria novifilia TaxID=2527975 RepID=A0A518BA31_9BACT|nr:hypothetical protein Pan216_47100 [Planctomycetes bacterium Pan216]
MIQRRRDNLAYPNLVLSRKLCPRQQTAKRCWLLVDVSN